MLHKTRGAEYKTIYVKKGDSFTLPGAENPEGYTFMGWSTKPNIVITGSKPGKVQYETGEVIPSVNSTIHLYQVMYQRNTEKNLISSQMAKPDLNRYGGVDVYKRQAFEAAAAEHSVNLTMEFIKRV